MSYLLIGVPILAVLINKISKYKVWVNDIKTQCCYKRYSKIARMNLATLLAIYRVNPKRFRYIDGCTYRKFNEHEILHILYNGHQEDRKTTAYSWWNSNPIEKTINAEDRWEDTENIVSIVLPFIDYFHFLKMVKAYNREQEKERTKKTIYEAKQKEILDTQFVLESAQIDITKLMKENEKQLEQGRNIIINVLKNIAQGGVQ